MLRKRMAPWGPLENHEMPPRRRLLEAALHVVPLLRTTWKKQKKKKKFRAFKSTFKEDLMGGTLKGVTHLLLYFLLQRGFVAICNKKNPSYHLQIKKNEFKNYSTNFSTVQN